MLPEHVSFRLVSVFPAPALRLLRLFAGLVTCGIGVASMIQSDLGVPPWDVFHQGISFRTPLTIGQVSIVVGFAVMLLWIPLRQRPGFGTIANAIVIGTTMDLVRPLFPTDPTLATRWILVLAGPVLMGLGSALYIGARLGPGPRDGLMTGIAARGPSIRLARTVIEGTALIVGWVLGGRFGIGTILFAATVGPLVQFFMRLIPEHAASQTVEAEPAVGVA